MVASWKGHFEIVKHLVSVKASVATTAMGVHSQINNKIGDTALMIAKQHGKQEIVSFLSSFMK